MATLDDILVVHAATPAARPSGTRRRYAAVGDGDQSIVDRQTTSIITQPLGDGNKFSVVNEQQCNLRRLDERLTLVAAGSDNSIVNLQGLALTRSSFTL